MAFFDDLQRNIRRNGAHVTAGIIVLAIGAFLFEWLLHLPIQESLFFGGFEDGRLWTLLTYPFAIGGNGNALINLLFACYWIWWVGAALEREMGAARFLGFWLGMTVLAGLSMALCGSLLGLHSIGLAGIWLPEAALTVAWASRYPNQVVQLIIFPIQAKWIGILSAGLVLFGFGTPAPLMGVAACVHLLVAWAIASDRIPFLNLRGGNGTGGFSPKARSGALTREDKRPPAYFDEIRRREKERKERDELRKLFERSLIEDPDDKRDAGS